MRSPDNKTKKGSEGKKPSRPRVADMKLSTGNNVKVRQQTLQASIKKDSKGQYDRKSSVKDALKKGVKYSVHPAAIVSIGNHFPSEDIARDIQVLDSASVVPIVIKGVIQGYIQVTADGLGPSSDSYINANIAISSLYAVQAVTEHIEAVIQRKGDFTSEDMLKCLVESGRETYKDISSSNDNINPQDIQSSVVVSVILSNDRGTKYIAAGVGRSAALIMRPEADSDSCFEQFIEGESYLHYDDSQTLASIPESIQSVGKNTTYPIQVIEKQFEHQHGSQHRLFSVQFTEGIGNVLPAKMEDTRFAEQDSSVCGVQTQYIKCRELGQQFKKWRDARLKSKPAQLSPLDLTHWFNILTARKLLQDRDQQLRHLDLAERSIALCNKLIAAADKDKNFADASYTHHDLFLDLVKGREQSIYKIPSTDFTKDIIDYCHSAYEKYRDDTLTANQFVQELRINPYSGDDATISMLGFLDRHQEYLRAWVDSPGCRAHHLYFLCQLSEDQVKRAVERLKKETYSPQSAKGVARPLEELKPQELYAEGTFDSIVQLLDRIRALGLVSEIKNLCSAIKDLNNEEIFQKLEQLFKNFQEQSQGQLQGQLQEFSKYALTLPGAPNARYKKVGCVTTAIGGGMSIVGSGSAAVATFVLGCSLFSPPALVVVGAGVLLLLIGLTIRYLARQKGPSKAATRVADSLQQRLMKQKQDSKRSVTDYDDESDTIDGQTRPEPL